MLEKNYVGLDARSKALGAFWSVYMFERRVSLGLGIPFYLQDSYVDPFLFDLVSHREALRQNRWDSLIYRLHRTEH